MTRQRKWATITVIVVVIGVFTAWAMRPEQKPTIMRVQAIKVRDDETTFHWKWTFTSERHWKAFHSTDQGEEHVIVLEPLDESVGPLERLRIRDWPRVRTRVYVYEIEVVREEFATAPGQTAYKARINMGDQNGEGPSLWDDSFRLIPDGELSRQFKALRTSDGRLDLPARVPLAVIDGKTQILVLP